MVLGRRKWNRTAKVIRMGTMTKRPEGGACGHGSMSRDMLPV